MFVAWKDLRFARGRFALMGTVVVLITLLVGLLSGLTAGLARDNTSAITSLTADRLAFDRPPEGQEVSFTHSSLTEDAWRAWARQPGVTAAEPLGIRTTEARAGERTAAVSVFGAEPGSSPAPAVEGFRSGRAVLSVRAAEELGAAPGDPVRIGDVELTVAAVRGEESYSHTPVVWTSLDDWQRLVPGGGGDAPDQATVVALTTNGGADPAAGDRAAGTESRDLDGSLSALASHDAENGSLRLMRGFLFTISALVVGAFFTVWTIQRGGDIAVLKALGASTPYLLRDALGQAVLLLGAGTVLGTALTVPAGRAVAGAVPFVLDPVTLLLPAAVIAGLGLAGAALAVRRITAVDPLVALGSVR
ncbi:ABC transporter permease [Streptomyces chryseus]|uniref:ABC transporter substrate-binding protein n=1 Tax=Streptomyces chryseus TaxID=68186 RepID=A0ABQ3DMZ2_9ACTN|nr:ABC transporter permease [Streptomyces chryseus]GHB00292.1 ABC transporter substrate-binding protein [Streptomyces chryseus]